MTQTGTSVSPIVLQAAAREAKTALHNGWQEVVDCPHCTRGSVIHHGSMWWQTQRLRCSYCHGIGRVYRQETFDPSSRSDAASADTRVSGLGSAGRVQGAK